MSAVALHLTFILLPPSLCHTTSKREIVQVDYTQYNTGYIQERVLYMAASNVRFYAILTITVFSRLK